MGIGDDAWRGQTDGSVELLSTLNKCFLFSDNQAKFYFPADDTLGEVKWYTHEVKYALTGCFSPSNIAACQIDAPLSA